MVHTTHHLSTEIACFVPKTVRHPHSHNLPSPLSSHGIAGKPRLYSGYSVHQQINFSVYVQNNQFRVSLNILLYDSKLKSFIIVFLMLDTLK
jgi:hypothetical protein